MIVPLLDCESRIVSSGSRTEGFHLVKVGITEPTAEDSPPDSFFLVSGSVCLDRRFGVDLTLTVVRFLSIIPHPHTTKKDGSNSTTE
jgi:hypothetical protein